MALLNLFNKLCIVVILRKHLETKIVSSTCFTKSLIIKKKERKKMLFCLPSSTGTLKYRANWKNWEPSNFYMTMWSWLLQEVMGMKENSYKSCSSIWTTQRFHSLHYVAAYFNWWSLSFDIFRIFKICKA